MVNFAPRAKVNRQPFSCRRWRWPLRYRKKFKRLYMENNRRVVVVGMGIRSPIGNTLDEFEKSLKEGRSGISTMPEWEDVKRLRTRVAGLCHIEGQEDLIPRTSRRSMGRGAILAALSAMDAVKASGLSEDEIASSICGVSFGSN